MVFHYDTWSGSHFKNDCLKSKNRVIWKKEHAKIKQTRFD